MEMSEGLEDLAQLCRDFIDLGEDKDVWERHLETLEEVMAEVKRLREGIKTYLENAKSACNEILKLRELIE